MHQDLLAWLAELKTATVVAWIAEHPFETVAVIAWIPVLVGVFYLLLRRRPPEAAPEPDREAPQEAAPAEALPAALEAPAAPPPARLRDRLRPTSEALVGRLGALLSGRRVDAELLDPEHLVEDLFRRDLVGSHRIGAQPAGHLPLLEQRALVPTEGELVSTGERRRPCADEGDLACVPGAPAQAALSEVST